MQVLLLKTGLTYGMERGKGRGYGIDTYRLMAIMNHNLLSLSIFKTSCRMLWPISTRSTRRTREYSSC